MNSKRDVESFTRGWLRWHGFVGFVSVRVLRGGRRSEIPIGAGVYVVLRESDTPPEFLDQSPAGWHKNRDPTVDAATLRVKWVEDVPTLYIGKADNLRRRVGQLIDFGSSQPVAHHGGRLLWQVAGSKEFVVAWREDGNPREAERHMINEFRATYGKHPFANLSN